MRRLPLSEKPNWTKFRKRRAASGRQGMRWIFECSGCGMRVQGAASTAVVCLDCDRAMLAVPPKAVLQDDVS